MKYMDLRGELINLDNVNRIQRVQPGEQEMIGFKSVNIDSHEIRFYLNDGNYLPIIYGSDSIGWRDDWDRIFNLTVDSAELMSQSSDRGDER